MSEKINPNLTFEIDSSKKLFNKLLEEYADFDKDHLNPRFAMNCATDSWHLTDWTYHEFHKSDLRFQDSESIDKNGTKKFISGILKYQQYVSKQCSELEFMRLISNGTKHCILRDKNRKEKTKLKTGDFSHKDYCRHDYDVNRFVIEIDTVNIDFETTLLKTIEYWRNILE
ncbi:hypothetical protein [Psychroserpens algicola]|uniref:hypothetical protein n=1 Tax=Psychroserpens algicola TaxID=1719034 RepID=UPI00195360A9|nr:hypothetical protein [Psychroserpens algicola]